MRTVRKLGEAPPERANGPPKLSIPSLGEGNLFGGSNVYLGMGRSPDCRGLNQMAIDLLTICKYTIRMIMELLGHKDYLRILMVLEKKPLRFTEIQKVLGLNPTQVDRALTFLRKGLWVIPQTLPTEKGPIRVEYSVGKRGAAFLALWQSFKTQAKRHEAELGKSEVAELQSLSR